MPQLMPGERSIRVTRQHWTIFIPIALACGAALIVGIVLLAVTPSSVGGHDIGEIKLLIGLGLGVVVLATFLARWLQWRFLQYVLTDHRIIVQRGILSRYTESIALDRVQDSSVRQRLIARILRFGDVEIESAGREGSEILHHIADPAGYGNDLLMAIEARRTGVSPTGPVASGPASHDGGYAPPNVQGSPGQPGGFGPSPGYSRHQDGL